MLTANQKDFISNQKTRESVKKYIEKIYGADQEIIKTVSCYVECEELLITIVQMQEVEYRNPDNYENIIELCPTYRLERKLSKAYQENTKEKIINVLEKISNICVAEINDSEEVNTYKEELRKKICKFNS